MCFSILEIMFLKIDSLLRSKYLEWGNREVQTSWQFIRAPVALIALVLLILKWNTMTTYFICKYMYGSLCHNIIIGMSVLSELKAEVSSVCSVCGSYLTCTKCFSLHWWSQNYRQVNSTLVTPFFMQTYKSTYHLLKYEHYSSP